MSKKSLFFIKKKLLFFRKKSYFFLEKKLLFFTKKSYFFFTKKSYFFLQKKVTFFYKKKYFSHPLAGWLGRSQLLTTIMRSVKDGVWSKEKLRWWL